MPRLLTLLLCACFCLSITSCSNLKDSTILKGNDTVVIMKLSSTEDENFSLSQVGSGDDGYFYNVEHLGHKAGTDYYIHQMDQSGTYHPYDYVDDYDSKFHSGSLLSRDFYGNLEPLGQRRYSYTTQPQKINYLGDVKVVKDPVNDGYNLEVSDNMAAAKAFIEANYPSLAQRYEMVNAVIREE